MLNEGFRVPTRKVESEGQQEILTVHTPEEAVRVVESKGVVFLSLPVFEQKKPRLGELLKSKSERSKQDLLNRLEPLLRVFKESGRTITEVRYNSAVADRDIKVGGWHEDDPYSTYPDGWIRILLTTEGDSTEYKQDDGSIARPDTEVVSVHTGHTVHRAPAERKGKLRTQLMVNMVFNKD